MELYSYSRCKYNVFFVKLQHDFVFNSVLKIARYFLGDIRCAMVNNGIMVCCYAKLSL